MKNFTLWGGALLLALPALASPPQEPVPMASGTVEFVANRQQWNSAVLFATDLPAGRMYLEQGRLVSALFDGKQVDELQHHADKLKDYPVKAHAYSTTFVGANLAAAVKGESQMASYSNFFLGNDPKRWASKVPSFEGVRYQALYPGVDLHFYSKEKALEYDFEVAAGADASRITLRYDGPTKLSVVNGALHIGTSVGTVVEQKPVAYQLVNGQRQSVACDYVLGNKNTVTFRLPQGYNHALPLVIDPVLVYATYSGSSASNYGFTATYDALGNVYSGGNVFSTGYPVTMGAYQTTYKGGTDMGLIKYNPRAATGPESRVWATYLGGNNTDQPHSLLTDTFGNLIVMGSSQSTNYPTLGNSYGTTLSGTYDIVITKFTDDGAVLRGSTYLGGAGADGYMASGSLDVNYGDHSRGDLAVDAAGNIYVASLGATGFPTAGGATQTSFGGGTYDGVVAKLNTGLTSLLWSTYIGGSGDDAAYSLQVDANNNVFVSGGTSSTNLPSTTGAFKAASAGGVDGFVTRLSPTGATVRTTYLGTSAYDQAYLLQLDTSGAVYTFGQTAGAYPVTSGTYSNPGSRLFLQKLDNQLTSSVWSTVIGNGATASPSLSPTAFSVTDCGNILLSGWTPQSGYPVTADALQSTGGSGTSNMSSTYTPGWFWVAQFTANATNLTYATYYGNGSCHVDGGTSRFDKLGNVYQSMCVSTSATALTTTANGWTRTPPSGAGWNNATFKMDVAPLSVVFTPSVVQSGPRAQQGCAPQTFYFARASTTGTATWDFGDGSTPVSGVNSTSHLYTTPGVYQVKLTVTDSSQGCNQTATSTETVTVYGIQPAAVGPDRTICPGGNVTLSVPNQGAGVTYSWSPAAGLNTTTGNTVIASPSVSTTYTVTVANANCASTATVRVNVSPPPSADAGPAQTICAGGSTTLSVPDAGTGATYLWSPATGLNSTTSRTVTANPTANTTYTVRVTTSGGCSSTGTVAVNIAPAPQVIIRQSANNVLPGTGITFTAVPQNSTSGITAYQWNFGDGSATSTTTMPTYAYTQPGPYTVSVKVTYGPSCIESATLPITIRQFQLPNVITPNADGKNDTFKPSVSDGPVNIEIYDRWGRKVFEQQNYAGSWGSDADTAPGIYYYKISATSGQTWKGWLEVIK